MWTAVMFLVIGWLVIQGVEIVIAWLLAAGPASLRILGILAGIGVLVKSVAAVGAVFLDGDGNQSELLPTLLVYGYAVWSIGQVTIVGALAGNQRTTA